MLYIGPHVSISGGISLATDRARLLNATGFAIFTKNQRIWKCPPLSKDDAAAFVESIKEDAEDIKAEAAYNKSEAAKA